MQGRHGSRDAQIAGGCLFYSGSSVLGMESAESHPTGVFGDIKALCASLSIVHAKDLTSESPAPSAVPVIFHLSRGCQANWLGQEEEHRDVGRLEHSGQGISKENSSLPLAP